MSPLRIGLLGFLILGIQAFSLMLSGQPPICECDYIKVWEGVVLSSGNSQHLTDWYTFSHVIHGFLFYLALWFFFPRMPIATRFLFALGVEVLWEIVENTPWLIEHYREQALAQGYVGDSIINSLMDTFAEALGFVLAWRLPVFLIVALGVGFELFVGYSIHDNLFLNVLNFFHRFDFIATWQSVG